MSATVLIVGLGRETRDWLAGGHADPNDVLVVDERPGPDVADPVLAGQSGHVAVRTPVDLDGPARDVLGDDVAIDDVTLVVRSPGASPYRRALAEMRDAGVDVVTATGWWLAAARPSDLVAVTGTKGKSTTAAMTAHVLRAAGADVALCGNIGVSPLTGVHDVSQTIVLELSSYQLADLDAPIPLAGLTTVMTDHVPWHGSVARYHADKTRLLDLADRRLATRAAAEHPAVGGRVDAVADVAVHRPRLTAALRSAGLFGEHLVDDAALAVALADASLAAAGRTVAPAELLDALHDFQPLPHRLTPVAEVAGVRYVDDSISTVPEAALAALAAYRPAGAVTLLLGGDDRGQNVAPLVAALEDDDVRAVLIGAFGARLAEALSMRGSAPVVATDLEDAVRLASAVTPAGGAVLLSPAAPSFGTHRDFVHRGEDFTARVADLARAASRPPVPGTRHPVVSTTGTPGTTDHDPR